MVDLVLKNGKEKKIDSESAGNLGLEGELAVKQLRYKLKESSFGQEHGFAVVLSADPDGKVKPVAIAIRISKVFAKGDAKFIEGWGFRASMEGKLQNAYWVEGEVGVEVTQTVKSVDSKEVKEVFRKEKDLFLKIIPPTALSQ